jgi:D-3-phosphoglycerate dehydrogenase
MKGGAVSSPKVLLTDGDLGDRGDEASWLTQELSVDVVIADCRTAADVLAQVEEHTPVAIVTQWAPISAEVIDAAVGCRIISRLGIGVDMIDTGAAARAGIRVRNVPHYCTEEVATHAVAMALSLWRRLPQLDAEVRAGTWAASAHASEIGRLSRATLGLIGAGRIGQSVARAFEALGSSVIVVDPAPASDSFERVSLSDLARRADIISLHAPLLETTRHIIDDQFLSQVERRPVIVNTSRGALVDLSAAARAVNEGKLRGLALDVFEEEPLSLDHPVRDAVNTLLAPHAAWCSDAALPDLRRGAIDNVIEALPDLKVGR